MKTLILIIQFFVYSVAAYCQSVPSYVPTSGLLAWYPFSGNAVDSSGGGHDGTVHEAVLTTDRFGNANSAYQFFDTSSISTTLLPPTGNGARTISCWFKYDSLYDACNQSLVIAGYGANTGDCSEVAQLFSLEVVYPGIPATVRVDGTCVATKAQHPSATDTLDNGWHFFAALYDTSYGPDFDSVKIYLDCAYRSTVYEQWSSPITVNTGNLSTFLIGKSHILCTRYFRGKIDDIGVWNRVLTDSELAQLCSVRPTLINRVESNNYVNIFPNPATSSISVKSNITINKLEISDAVGRIFFSEQTGNNSAIIDISRFEPRIYFVKVNGVNVQKLVKQ